MKKRTIGPLAIIGLIIAFTAFLLFLRYLKVEIPSEPATAVQAQKEQSQEQKSPAESSVKGKTRKKEYTIHVISPRILRIEAHLIRDYGSYRNSLSAGLKEISKKYMIEGITPIVSSLCVYHNPGRGILNYASFTSDLIVLVKPKK